MEYFRGKKSDSIEAGQSEMRRVVVVVVIAKLCAKTKAKEVCCHVEK